MNLMAKMVREKAVLGHPKPEPLAKSRARKRREDAAGLAQFRTAVWHRERLKVAHFDVGLAARCQHCDIWVVPHGSPYGVTGSVHHRIGRRAKATRYDPANGVLLCDGV